MIFLKHSSDDLGVLPKIKSWARKQGRNPNGAGAKLSERHQTQNMGHKDWQKYKCIGHIINCVYLLLINGDPNMRC